LEKLAFLVFFGGSNFEKTVAFYCFFGRGVKIWKNWLFWCQIFEKEAKGDFVVHLERKILKKNGKEGIFAQIAKFLM
jgi:hypothetical protein